MSKEQKQGLLYAAPEVQQPPTVASVPAVTTPAGGRVYEGSAAQENGVFDPSGKYKLKHAVSRISRGTVKDACQRVCECQAARADREERRTAAIRAPTYSFRLHGRLSLDPLRPVVKMYSIARRLQQAFGSTCLRASS